MPGDVYGLRVDIKRQRTRRALGGASFQRMEDRVSLQGSCVRQLIGEECPVMLKGLDPLLTADLLYVLRAMGHGDELVVADTNFPAVAMARRLVRLDGADGPRALRAILSIMPLDDFVEEPCARMAVVDDPDAEPPVCREYQSVIDAAENGRFQLGQLERAAFYERARAAFAVVQTGENRLYGNVLLKMGVIRPE